MNTGIYILIIGVIVAFLAFIGGLINMGMATRSSGAADHVFERHLVVMGLFGTGGVTALVGLIVAVVEYLS